MGMIQIEAQLTRDQLLKAVERMPGRELNDFVDQVVVMRANLRKSKLSLQESQLLATINRGLEATSRQRFKELVDRREIADLTDLENAEFLALAERYEALNVERMSALAQLAQLRGNTLREVMQELDIKSPPDA